MPPYKTAFRPSTSKLACCNGRASTYIDSSTCRAVVHILLRLLVKDPVMRHFIAIVSLAIFSFAPAAEAAEQPEIQLTERAAEIVQYLPGKFVWAYRKGADTMTLGSAVIKPDGSVTFQCRYWSDMTQTPPGGFRCTASVDLNRPSRLVVSFPPSRSEMNLVIWGKGERLFGSASFDNSGWSGQASFDRVKN